MSVDDCNTTLYNQTLILGCGDLSSPFPGHNSTLEPKMTADAYDVWNYYKQHGKDTPLHADYRKGEPTWGMRNVTLYANGTMLKGVSTPGDQFKMKIKHILTSTDAITPQGTFRGDRVVQRFVPILEPMR
eukprot:gene37828-46676_t